MVWSPSWIICECKSNLMEHLRCIGMHHNSAPKWVSLEVLHSCIIVSSSHSVSTRVCTVAYVAGVAIAATLGSRGEGHPHNEITICVCLCSEMHFCPCPASRCLFCSGWYFWRSNNPAPNGCSFRFDCIFMYLSANWPSLQSLLWLGIWGIGCFVGKMNGKWIVGS